MCSVISNTSIKQAKSVAKRLGLFFSVASVALAACATRAPSSNELDKKAGLSPALEADAAKKDAKELRKSEEKKKEKDVDPDKPRRSFPRIERIWVYGQELAPTVYMQGTNLFLEVTPGAWISSEGGAQ